MGGGRRLATEIGGDRRQSTVVDRDQWWSTTVNDFLRQSMKVGLGRWRIPRAPKFRTSKNTNLTATGTLHPSAMRDLTSCFGDHAVKVSDASCSGNTSHTIFPTSAAGCRSATSHIVSTDHPSFQIATTFLFKSKLSSRMNPLVINLTWSRNHTSTSLSVSFPEFLHSWKPTFVTKKKGTHSFIASSSTIILHWDFSAATFSQGPDPINNFYVVVIVNSEFALLLGDQIQNFLQKFSQKFQLAEFSMICRKEQVVGRTLYSISRARFGDGEKLEHEITIRSRGGAGLDDGKGAELLIFVDKKQVVHVTKLNWNFRGNQTIFIDGSPVDVMWDMHGWWFSGMVGQSVFMFKKRSSLESRLSLEEQGTVGFSLLIHAFKSP
ncbi:uncharacterized protein LOC110025309 [Phalaenopsis equestris]|uniref:uncharacterized protein LOC110025309 n=1 Tax=Phalaenopsis equestris TaxID=78828 RepID=UPI0009E27B41|nr:uncharacterized protein LOC110025309 [Phalaenopsis equestris]